MACKYVYIHGASATGESFNYIRQHIGTDSDIVLEYDSRIGFRANLESMLDRLPPQDLFFICHSLGGIYALHIADRIPDQVRGAVTICTPYGGAEVADYAKYFYFFSQLLRDIGPKSWPMSQADRIAMRWPWTNIVGMRGGAPWILEPNDGVVTQSSMRHRCADMELVEVACNHYESVLSPEVVEAIRARLPKI
jgi:pimeloyl-ACP methyl ester carboxylesterase